MLRFWLFTNYTKYLLFCALFGSPLSFAEKPTPIHQASTHQTSTPTPTSISNPLIVTYLDSDSKDDVRGVYEKEVLELVLEKTSPKYGKYLLMPATPGITNARARRNMHKSTYANFIRGFAYRSSFAQDQNITAITFPIYFGILSYRVCFVSDKVKEKVAKAQSLNDLLKFTHGQGIGWLDSEILRKTGFKVVEVSSYESLFSITATNRVDLFCRGINEYLQEYTRYKNIEGLSLDESLAFYYPFPIYLHTNSKNKTLIERITEGLTQTYEDGSLRKLWEQHFLESIEKANLHKRKIYTLINHALDGNQQKYTQYFIPLDKSISKDY